MRKTPLNNQKGAALLMALFSVTLIIFLAVEVSYETTVEYRVATADYHRLKAHYAAKAGVELSLLRIQLYQTVLEQFKDQLKGNTQFLDLIWTFPFSWPPVAGTAVSRVDKEQIEGVAAESLMDAQYFTTISSEGGKIDLNDLASPSEALRLATRRQLTQLLENRLSQDDDWARDNQNLRVEDIINNIQDWIDADDESLTSGSEKSMYSDREDSEFLPPNQPFKTLKELHMVEGITDEIYEVLSGQVTVYGLKGINVNYADKKVIMSIDPQITEEVADEILKRRQDQEIGPFKDENDFNSFIQSEGINMDRFNESQIPLYFDAEYNFKITSTGLFGNSQREIIAIVYDFDTVRERLEKLLATTTTTGVQQSPPPGAVTTTTSSTTTTTQVKKGGRRPTVIYWIEN